MLSYIKLLCGLLFNDLRPSDSMNRIGDPKKVILAALGDSWVEQSPLGVCPPSANYPGSNYLLFPCDLILYLYFVYKVCSVFTKVE